MQPSRVTELFHFCSYGMIASVERILSMRGIDVEARKVDGEDEWSCLMSAAHFGHIDICRLLIDKGAQLEAKGSGGRTPLHWAAEQGHVEIVRLLCDRGADVEAHTIKGSRPLHSAAYNGHISIVIELIEERNAEINARSDDGLTALTFAVVMDKPDIAAYLIAHGGIE